MAAFVARFGALNRTREGRVSASFDAVRVFLSARAQVGSVSQLLRLNAAEPLVADVADIEMNRRPMVGAIDNFYSRPTTRFWVVQSNGRSTCGVSFRLASSPRSAIASTIFGAINASRMRRAT